MRKSFTLVEVLLAVGILSVIVLATSNVIASLKISKQTLKNAYDDAKTKELAVKTLYSDIMNSDGNVTVLTSDDKKFSRVFLRTKNTLYKNIYPYVMWYVSRNKNALVRMECYHKIGIKELNTRECVADLFLQNVKKFEIYKNRSKYLIYIQQKKPIIFEMFQGVDLEKNKTKPGSKTEKPKAES